MIIAVDLDDVLANTVEAFISYYNQHHTAPISEADVTTSDWSECLRIPPAEIGPILIQFTNSDAFRQMSPLPGAVEAVSTLARSHQLHVVTSRWGPLVEVTVIWLNWHFSNSIAETHYSRTSHRNPFNGTAHDKPEICRQIGSSVIIEDCPNHARNCLSAGMSVVLLDRPWNQELADGNLIRAASWSNVLEAISTITERRAG